MTDTDILHIAFQTMMVALKVSGPILVASLGVGLAISLFQALTQINEVTLTFVPKLLATGIVLMFAGNWMLHTLVDFTQNLWMSIDSYL